ncbi:MAG: sensor histidine kinase [Rhizobiaceae bacterium]
MKSIRTRLLLWLMIPLSIVAAFVSLETFDSSRKISNDLNDRTLLAATLTILEHVISTNGNLLADATLETLTENLGDRFFYHVRGPDGAFVTGYSQFPRPPDNVEQGPQLHRYYDGIHQGVPVRVVQLKRDLTDRELNGVTTITTWQHVTKRQDLTISLFTRSLTRLVLLVLAAGGIVWIAVLFGLRPLLQLQSAIDSRTPYDLTPIKRRMPSELAGIVSSMNELFDRVARSKANRERFVGDAAHQLRNPIAALKVQAETALDSGQKENLRISLEQVVETTNQTGQMVEQMLASARANTQEFDSGESFDLNSVAEGAARTCAISAMEKDQDLSFVPGDHPIIVKGNLILVQEAVANLIDNAVRHSPEGGEISVIVIARPDHNTCHIEISDSGELLNAEDLVRLSQPFSTGNAPSSGSGLGLSIAKDVARAHGGDLTVSPSNKGKGKTISISLAVEATRKTVGPKTGASA